MPKKEHVIRVFVASPSDVAEERVCLEHVVRELNIAWSDHFHLRLDLLKWETHTRPGFGDYPQEVVNEQLGDDYDIFIGMMWSRFGTPTQHYGSGTEEEFSRAFSRHLSDSRSIRLMLYFKDAPIPKAQIDTEQLAKVNAFQSSIPPKGGVSWQFQDVDQFSKLLRIHLSKEIQSWYLQLRKPKSAITRKTGYVTVGNQIVSKVEIQAFLKNSRELIAEAQKKFADAGDARKQILQELITLNEYIIAHLRTLKRYYRKNANRPKIESALNETLQKMTLEFDKCADVVAVCGPQYRRLLSEAIDLVITVVTHPFIRLKTESGDKRITVAIRFALSTAEEMVDLAGELENIAIDGIKIVQSLDIAESRGTNSQRLLLEYLNELRQEFTAAQCVVRDLRRALQELLKMNIRPAKLKTLNR